MNAVNSGQNQDLFGNPAPSSGSPRGTAGSGHGHACNSAAVPFLTLQPLATYRKSASPLRLTRSDHPEQSRPQAEQSKGPEVALPPPCDATARRGETYTPVRAMEDVLTLRHQQIFTHGHTLEADLALIERTGKRHAVAKLARQAMNDAVEDMMFNKSAEQVRRRLLKATALGLAAIDAEDARNA